MINSVLVFNNSGQPRLTKFYSHLDISLQQRLLSEIFSLVSTRPPTACNFLPLPPLLTNTSSAFSSDNTTSSSSSTNNIQIIYRHYATLYFILISDDLESELGLLDLIQVFVESLDKVFENVCELDLIFGFEEVHTVLGEMIQGGCVVETDISKIVGAVKRQGRVLKKKGDVDKWTGNGGASGSGHVGSGRVERALSGLNMGGMGMGMGIGSLGEGGWTGR